MRPTLSTKRIRYSTTPKQLHETIKHVGRAIRSASSYLPIRNHSAGLATRANPKNYLGQARALFDDFTKRQWRYVQDPLGTELLHDSGRSLWGQVAGANARDGERGSGDCDDATAYLGAAFMSIGLPVMMATVAPPNSRHLFTHILPMVNIKKLGWLPADPVAYPRHGLGWLPPSSRVAIWDLDGRLVSARGSFPRGFEKMLSPA